MPRIPRADTYQAKLTSAEILSKRDNTTKDTPAVSSDMQGSGTGKSDTTQATAFRTLPHPTPRPPTTTVPTTNTTTTINTNRTSAATVPLSAPHLTKASAVYKFHRKGQFFPGVRAHDYHHYHYYDNDDDINIQHNTNGKATAGGTEKDTMTGEGSPMQDHIEAEMNTPAEELTRKEHNTASPQTQTTHKKRPHRNRDALARVHHRNFLKLCGKLPTHSTPPPQSGSGQTTPSTSRTSQPFLSLSSPPMLTLSGTHTQRSIIAVPPSNLHETLNNTSTMRSLLPQLQSTSPVVVDPVPLTEESELVFGIGTHGLCVRDTPRGSTHTAGFYQSTQQLPAKSGSSPMRRHITDLAENVTESNAHEGNPLSAQTPHNHSARSRPADTMNETMKGNTATTSMNGTTTTTAKANVFARLRGKKDTKPVPCNAANNNNTTLPRLVKNSNGTAAAQSGAVSNPLSHAAGLTHTGTLPGLAHLDASSSTVNDTPQGGVMDVFGYFATHRVQPEYYARLKADHDGRRRERTSYMRKTMPKLTAMRTVAVD